MKSLLINGCYDFETMKTIKSYGVEEFSFDLRARSPNLIPLKDLLILLRELRQEEKVFLSFENDKNETILSYLNILKKEPFKFFLLFRDKQSSSFYEELNRPFYWMFDPEGEWKEILLLENIEGVLLPLKYQAIYQNLPEMWDIIDQRHLDLYLHAGTFEETSFMSLNQDLKISIDLTSEVETSFRHVDQEKLKKMKIWRRLNENSAGQ